MAVLIMALAIVLLVVALGTGLAYFAGVFNPIGYVHLRPWDVPACPHGYRIGDLGRCDH